MPMMGITQMLFDFAGDRAGHGDAHGEMRSEVGAALVGACSLGPLFSQKFFHLAQFGRPKHLKIPAKTLFRDRMCSNENNFITHIRAIHEMFVRETFLRCNKKYHQS